MPGRFTLSTTWIFDRFLIFAVRFRDQAGRRCTR
ncbi:Uncharacterised protein [Mycobacterium tuberculosis]|nr:Uncharacterised protein [Mycobacterium tuberculosis]CKT49768.1 Uncharacterised protein [Mycobacterium tuberculosis]